MSVHQISKIRKGPLKGLPQAAFARPLYYAESLAASLILFARQDPEFAAAFGKLIRKTPFPSETELDLIKANPGISILLPETARAARRRAAWLLRGLKENRDPARTAGAAAILAAWVRDKPIESPKHIVVGALMVAIPGITLGRIHHNAALTLILRDDLCAPIFPETVSRITRLPCTFIAGILKENDYEPGRMEPEIADWFFGDKHIALYKTEETKLAEMMKELADLGIPHETLEERGRPAILAVTPAANNLYEERRWKLDPLTFNA